MDLIFQNFSSSYFSYFSKKTNTQAHSSKRIFAVIFFYVHGVICMVFFLVIQSDAISRPKTLPI